MPRVQVGDSISIGWAPVLFPMLNSTFASQHDAVNAGPASKGHECIRHWLGIDVHPPQQPHPRWSVVMFNFGLHSLDDPPTGETETLANYTIELR